MSRALPLCSTLFALASCTLPNPLPTDEPGSADGPLALLGSEPAADQPGVSLIPDIRLVFDGMPDPDVVASFGPLTLRSGVNSYDYHPRVDLVGKAILLRPRTPLFPDTEYTVFIGPSVRSLDGRTVGRQLFTRFTTAAFDIPAENSRYEPPRRSLSSDVQPLLSAGCAVGLCHDAATRSGALDLSSAAASLANLVDVEAVGVRMARVAPYDAAHSYLLRKLLGAPHIAGVPMPIGGRWSDDDLRMVSDWIASGAAP